MATLVFVDKENKEPGTHMAPKDGQKLGLGLVRLLLQQQTVDGSAEA